MTDKTHTYLLVTVKEGPTPPRGPDPNLKTEVPLVVDVESCSHCVLRDEGFCNITEQECWIGGTGGKIPESCPLRSGPVVVRLKP